VQDQLSPEQTSSILAPTTPPDVGERSQRQRIVEALIASCAEKTFAATTITDIVAGARISRTTFYKRFEDKRECFDAAIDYGLAQLQAAAAAAHTPSDPPAEAVRKATAALLAKMSERPDVGQLLTGDAVAVDPLVVDRYRRLVIPAVAGLWEDSPGRAGAYTDPCLAFGRAQVLVFNKIAARRSDQLMRLLPELVYLGVAPFAGHAEALRQAQRSEESQEEAAGAGAAGRDGDR
jgi:AcrR family transcriptional regulator